MYIGLIKSKRAQSVLEMGILLGIVAMALLGMQIYIKRGVQGSLRKAVDADPNGDAAGFLQFEPKYASSVTDQSANSSETLTNDGGSLSSFSSRNGTETTTPPDGSP